MLKSPGTQNNKLLRLEEVKKYFPVKGGGILRAVDGVSFSVGDAEVFGLVGESGCGKSTLARVILKLIEPTAGAIFFDNIDLVRAKGKVLFNLRKRLQIIFQDPYASLNPRKRVIDAVGEALVIHKIAKGKELRDKVVELLQRVGLGADALYKYPHEFSGGQRQRVCIARALAVSPKLIIADEPLSALDVSIQAQIINLLEDLQRESALSFVFISHNLKVIEHFSHRVAVMYLGRIVELAKTEDIFTEPFHPYTEALLSAVPEPEPEKKTKRIILEGDVPSPVIIPPGCPFHPRCPKRFGPCNTEFPAFHEARKDRWVSCDLWG
ncbi:MAG: ATP-binding cassette domain-containing protein [Nitrospirae bacterium]|nr:ATP-binding cassette domain-containing protein [Nitrospirota bacterium]